MEPSDRKVQSQVSNPQETRRKVLSAVLSVLVTLTILEVLTRVWIGYIAGDRQFLKYASLKQLQARPNLKPRYVPHRYLGHCLSSNYVRGENRHNSLGYRSDEIPLPKAEGEFRIVCMGGSTTYTTEVDDYRLSYPNLLEKELHERGHGNVRVINAGVGSWTSWESLINFELRVLDLEPDMIILYDAINDLLTRFVWPPEAYRGDNSGAAAPPAMSMPSILEYSALMRYVLVRAGLVKPHSSMDRHLAAPPSTYYAAEFNKQKIRGTYPDGIFKKVSAEEMLRTNKPIYFRRNLENIAILANHRHIRTVLVTFASSPLFENQPIVSSPECRAAIAEMNETLKSIAKEQKVHLFDFASLFPADRCYYVDGVHVNVEGARLKAKLFAEYLHNNQLIDF